ncbi:sulfatase [Coraliomargarita algicola]
MSCCPLLLSAASNRPNIVVFLVDDMGLMDTSVPFLTDDQGEPKKYPLNDWYRTPHMEALAANGIRFSNFYAQSVCSPTRASIMTGQNATRHHTTNWIHTNRNNRGKYGPRKWNWEGLTKDSITLPRILQENGYQTIFVGKGHFGHMRSEGADPLNLGFDINIGGSAIGHPGSYSGDYGQRGNHPVPGLEAYHNTGTFLTEALTLEANKAVTAAIKKGPPFYLYLSHYAVHAPFHTDPRFIEHYKGKKNGRAPAYATLIEGMDKSLGDLVAHLQKLAVAEDTLIFFLGDNGSDAPLGEKTGHTSSAPLRGKKSTMYEGGTRVPFIAAWAKPNPKSELQKQWRIPHGMIDPNNIGTVMDLYATVLDAANAENPSDHTIDGSSLKKLLTGQADPDRRQEFLMHSPHDRGNAEDDPGRNYYTSLRLGDWKLIYQYFDETPYVLYNLKTDPFENHNLATEKPEKVQQLIGEMNQRLEAQDAQYPVKDGKEVKPQ